MELRPIPGLPPQACEALLGVLATHRPASDGDLTLRGERLRHGDLLALMGAIDDLRAHVQRVGQLVLRRPASRADSSSAAAERRNLSPG